MQKGTSRRDVPFCYPNALLSKPEINGIGTLRNILHAVRQRTKEIMFGYGFDTVHRYGIIAECTVNFRCIGKKESHRIHISVVLCKHGLVEIFGNSYPACYGIHSGIQHPTGHDINSTEL